MEVSLFNNINKFCYFCENYVSRNYPTGKSTDHIPQKYSLIFWFTYYLQILVTMTKYKCQNIKKQSNIMGVNLKMIPCWIKELIWAVCTYARTK